MTRKVPVSRVDREPMVVEDEAAADSRVEQITARPDGYYWQDAEGKQEFGPFASLELALADIEATDEQTPGPGETLQEAEDEIGIADWIDPETGEPAEGQSRPRLDEV